MVLVPFVPLAVALLCLALATVITVLMVNVMQKLGGIPGVGGYLVSAARGVATTISRVLSAAVSGIEGFIGGTFHLAASYLDKTWRLISDTPAVLEHVARVVGDQLYRVSGLEALVRFVHSFVREISRDVTRLNKEYHGIEHGVRTLEHEISKGIGDDILPHLKTLDRAVTHLENTAIPALTDGVADAGENVTALGDYIAKNYVSEAQLLTEATAAAVLTAAGVSWLRCNSNPFNRNTGACNLWGDLADILGLVVALEAALDFETLVHECQDVAAFTTTAIQDVFGLNAPPTSGGL